MSDLISRDDLAKQLHEVFTDTMHPKFGNRAGK